MLDYIHDIVMKNNKKDENIIIIEEKYFYDGESIVKMYI